MCPMYLLAEEQDINCANIKDDHFLYLHNYLLLIFTKVVAIIPEPGCIVWKLDVDTGVVAHLMLVDGFSFPVGETGDKLNPLPL